MAVDAPAEGPGGSGRVDGELVARALAGSPPAFGELYDRHTDRVYRFLRFRVRDEVMATDLTQDVFVSALTHLPRLRQPDRFGAWLMQIAHNRALNHWAAMARRPPPESLDEAPDEPGADPGPGGASGGLEDPALLLETRLDVERVLAAADHLTEDQQAVLALRFAAELSLAETAEVLDKGEEAVKQLQRRAVASLRRVLLAEEGAA